MMRQGIRFLIVSYLLSQPTRAWHEESLPAEEHVACQSGSS